MCSIAYLNLLNVGPIFGVLFLGGGQLSFKFVNGFGNDDLMIADTFCVAFKFRIVAGLSQLLATVSVEILRLPYGSAGGGVGAAANVEFGNLSGVAVSFIKDTKAAFVSVCAGTVQVRLETINFAASDH